MKKLLFIFLTTFLFQSSWAIASTYCQHEAGQTTQHFGHHDLQHKTSSDEVTQDGKNGAKMHNDCGVCHSSCYKVLFSQLQNPIAPNNGSVFRIESTLSSSFLSDSLERPNWFLVV